MWAWLRRALRSDEYDYQFHRTVYCSRDLTPEEQRAVDIAFQKANDAFKAMDDVFEQVRKQRSSK